MAKEYMIVDSNQLALYEIPKSVATCLQCDKPLEAEVEEWTEDPERNGLMKAYGVHLECGTPGCVESYAENRRITMEDCIIEQDAVLRYLNSKYRWK